MTTQTVDPQQFVGMTKKQSQNKAEYLGLIWRLIRIDQEEFLSVPTESEKRDDRVCIEIDNGAVSKAFLQ